MTMLSDRYASRNQVASAGFKDGYGHRRRLFDAGTVPGYDAAYAAGRATSYWEVAEARKAREKGGER